MESAIDFDSPRAAAALALALVDARFKAISSLKEIIVNMNRKQNLEHNCARVLGFGKLVWHRTTKDKLLVEAGRSYLNRYTYIKAASNPLILCIDNTGVSISEPQVVLNKSLNSLSMVPECLIKLRRCLKVCCLVNDICIFLECLLERGVFPAI
jgi:hypothetical protein